MSSVGAALRAAVSVSSARAAASRKNGARSRGPKTAEGKARSAQNALKHGLRAQKHVVLPEENGGEFAALEAALIEELSPVGPLQAVLAQRIAVAAWRLARADRIEAEVLGHQRGRDGDLGLAVIRDGNGAGACPRCYATGAARSPSSCARCARSRRSRPSPGHAPEPGPKLRRRRPLRCGWSDPPPPLRTPSGPRRAQSSQSNPSAAGILANAADRPIACIRAARHAAATQAPPASRPCRCRRAKCSSPARPSPAPISPGPRPRSIQPHDPQHTTVAKKPLKKAGL